MNEEWKPVPGWPNYEASTLGRVRSIDREIRRMNRWGQPATFVKLGKILKPYVNQKGYHYNQLGADAKNKKETHYFVAITFLGPRPEGQQVNHKNGIKADNSLENLEWVTKSQNMRHAFDTNLNHSGAKHGISKLNEEQVTEIKKALIGKKKRGRPYYSDLATTYGVDRKTIEAIAQNKTWRHV